MSLEEVLNELLYSVYRAGVEVVPGGATLSKDEDAQSMFVFLVDGNVPSNLKAFLREYLNEHGLRVTCFCVEKKRQRAKVSVGVSRALGPSAQETQQPS